MEMIRADIHVLPLIFREKILTPSLSSVMLSVGFYLDTLCQLKEVLFLVWSVFVMKKYIYWDDHVFYSVNVVKYIMLFHFDWDTFLAMLTPMFLWIYGNLSWCVHLLPLWLLPSLLHGLFPLYIHSFTSDSSKVPHWVLYKPIKDV